jgi:hypothetical protein
VLFVSPNNEVLDSVFYPDENGPDALTNGQTLGRLPDGAETFVPTIPTTGQTNATEP